MRAYIVESKQNAQALRALEAFPGEVKRAVQMASNRTIRTTYTQIGRAVRGRLGRGYRLKDIRARLRRYTIRSRGQNAKISLKPQPDTVGQPFSGQGKKGLPAGNRFARTVSSRSANKVITTRKGKRRSMRNYLPVVDVDFHPTARMVTDALFPQIVGAAFPKQLESAVKARLARKGLL